MHFVFASKIFVKFFENLVAKPTFPFHNYIMRKFYTFVKQFFKLFKKIFYMQTFYVENYSLRMDTKILAKTILAVVKKEGAM